MHFAENLKQALSSLGANKLRSILTMLGIVMGVFSVVAIMAISNAAKVFMLNQFNEMGANTIMIFTQGNDLEDSDRLTSKDMDNIMNNIDEVEYVAANVSTRGEVKIDNETKDASITGVSSYYTKFTKFDITEGRFINEMDNEAKRKVAFVQDYFAEKYFGSNENAMGKEIKITNYQGDVMKCKIIGIESNEDDPFMGMVDLDDYPASILIPLTTYQEFTNYYYLGRVDAAVKDSTKIKSAGNKIVKLLEFTHNNDDKYQVQSIQDIQKQVDQVLGTISMVLLVIAIITLVVGGIGIINILLVSVTERIREIGIRKALGAQKRDIVLQFLTESILMTGTSGLIGIILGMICGAIISSVIKIPPVVDFKTIISTFLGSIILGLIFGVYPAKRAADLDPIESLRYE